MISIINKEYYKCHHDSMSQWSSLPFERDCASRALRTSENSFADFLSKTWHIASSITDTEVRHLSTDSEVNMPDDSDASFMPIHNNTPCLFLCSSAMYLLLLWVVNSSPLPTQSVDTPTRIPRIILTTTTFLPLPLIPRSDNATSGQKKGSFELGMTLRNKRRQQ